MRREGKKAGSFSLRLCKSPPKTPAEVKSVQVPAILVSRQSGGIGDLIMLTPTIRQIKQENPNIPLIVCTTSHYGVRGVLFDILKHNPYIDEVVRVEDLSRFRFQKIYDFNTGQEVKMETDASHPTGNRIDIFSEIAGIALTDKQTVYVVTPAEREWARNWIQKNVSLNKRRLIGIQVGTTTVRRDWPKDKQWLLAFRFLNSYPDCSVLFFHEGVAPEMDVYPNIYQIEGMLIRQVAALMNECELVVVPDSGLLHIAGALGKKMVALFGSNPPESRLLYYKNAIGIWLEYPCSVQNCWYDRCFHSFKCMSEITVEQVLEKVKDLLDGTVIVTGRERKKETLFLRMGGAGDLIMLSSSLQEYKTQHPEEKLVLATKPSNLDILKGAPFLERVIPIPESYRNFYSKVIDLRYKVESPEVGGTLDTEIYKKVNRMDVFDKLLGVKAQVKTPYVYVDQKSVEKLCKQIKHSTKYRWLGLHVSCTSNTRTIPPEYVPEIVKKFKEIKNLKIVLFGNKEFWGGRVPKVDFLTIRGRNVNVINLVGKTTFPEVIAICSLMDFIVGPDSVAIHIAGALKKKCLGLFGNIDPYTRIFYYPTVKAVFPLNELPCIPCWDFTNPCTVTNEIGSGCLRLLNSERVFKEAKEWFEL
jgi:ADP-heptose:LPS heptosyltransferase